MQEIIFEQTIASAEYSGREKAEKLQTIGYAVYFLFGIIEVLLAFCLVFKNIGATPISDFVTFIYTLTEIFIMLFAGMFRTAAVLGPATIVAVAVYAVLAWGIAQLVVILSGEKRSLNENF